MAIINKWIIQNDRGIFSCIRLSFITISSTPKFSSLLFIGLFLVEITFAQDFVGEKNKISVTVQSQFSLQENLEFFNYSRGLFYTGEHIYLSANMPPMVFKYDKEGVQTAIVAKQGRGPHEFLGPTVIAPKENNFAVYDAMQLKFTEFTAEGEPVEEFTGIKFSVGNFRFSNNLLFTYNVGKSNQPLIRVMGVEGTKLAENETYDTLTDKQLKLSRLSGTAPMAIKRDILYYGRIDETRIYWVNLKTGKKGNERFRDERFEAKKSKFSINDRAPKAENDWINYMFVNSSMRRIIPLYDYLLVEVQHGNMFDGTRSTVLHIFDYGFKKLDEIHFTHADLLNYGGGIQAASGNEIVFLQNFADATTKSGHYEPGMEFIQQEGRGKKVTIFEINKTN